MHSKTQIQDRQIDRVANFSLHALFPDARNNHSVCQ